MLRVLPARCLTWRMYVVSYQKNWLPPVSIYPARPVQAWQWLSRPVRGKDEATPGVAGGSSTYGSNLNKIVRLEYQGICPGVARTPEDFDPPSKFHISSSVPYIRYFTSAVMQFQFYKAMCEEAKHDGPLHTCDFYNSTEAGKLFGDVLALGKSRKWTDAISLLTKGRTSEMDAGPLLEYFQPLYEWLKRQNQGRTTVGWQSADSTSCPRACETS